MSVRKYRVPLTRAQIDFLYGVTTDVDPSTLTGCPLTVDEIEELQNLLSHHLYRCRWCDNPGPLYFTPTKRAENGNILEAGPMCLECRDILEVK